MVDDRSDIVIQVLIDKVVIEVSDMAQKQPSSGQQLYDRVGTWSRPQRSQEESVAWASSLNIDADVVSGSVSVAVTGDTTLQITGGAENQAIGIYAKQDGSGGHVFSPHASLKDSEGRLAEVITDPNSITLITCLFHDSAWRVVSTIFLGT